MITHLRLHNFRRHEDTELYFETGEHLILVGGANGVGKSTIFEAVLFALYGEGRNGRRNLDRLCRRGSEIEGTEVEVTFNVGSTSYRVQRRRDNGSTTALIWSNDVALTEGSREVTAEVTHILGMDSKGFRVATYAQQRELDGLASMLPFERGQMLSRLLRLDVITRAKDAAKANFRQTRAVISRLPEGAELDTLRRTLAEAETTLESQIGAVADARTELDALDTQIEAEATFEADYRAAVAAEAAARATVQAANETVTRLKEKLDEINIPDAIDGPGEPLETLRKEASNLEQTIATGELASRQQHERGAVIDDIGKIEMRLTSLDEILDIAAVDTSSIKEQISNTRTLRERLSADLSHAETDVGICKTNLERLTAQRQHAETLGDTCPTCGQEVTEEFRTTHLTELETAVADMSSKYEKARAVVGDIEVQCTKLDDDLTELTTRLETARAANDARQVAEIERKELLGRRDLHQRQLQVLPDKPIDLDVLYKRRGELAFKVDLATQAVERNAVRNTLIDRQRNAQQAVNDAAVRAKTAADVYTSAIVSDETHDAYSHHRELVQARQTEAAVLASLEKDAAVGEESVRRIAGEIKTAETAAAQRAVLVTEAEVAHMSAEVLGRVETRWAQQIRPALEGTVTELLSRLSDGRFDAVRLDSNYNLTVRDDGDFRNLTELSGGEIDLVALGMRLGLATVVAEHHGAGGPGFLILDECFGSQDPQRRIAIMTALRGLRSQYKQIFLISHIGGLEEAADSVIDVGWDRDTNTTTITSDQ